MSGTLNANYVQADVGTNLYVNTGLNSGNVIIGTPLVANTVTSNTGASLVLQSNNTTAITVDTSQNATFAGSINSPNTFGFKNRIMNGGMVIDQRNAGASTTPTTTVYTLDRWSPQITQSSKFSFQQVTDAPTGFSYSTKVTSLSAYTITSGDYFLYRQNIEGYNTADLGFGGSTPSTVTISFWVKSSLTGSFSASIYNSDGSRTYPALYTINSANTWEYKTITIAGSNSGTWGTTNGIGISIAFGLGGGSTYSSTAGSWNTSGSWTPFATGATQVVSTNAATWQVTGVQLEKGSTATSFDYRPYGTELALCYRYFYKTNPSDIARSGGMAGNAYNTSGAVVCMSLPVTMRATPTITRGGTLDNFYEAGVNGTLSASIILGTYSPTTLWWELSGTFSAGFQLTYNGQISVTAEL